MRKRRERLLSLLLVLAIAVGLLPGTAWAADGRGTGGAIVMSFELYDPTDHTVALLRGPEKVVFQTGATGLSLAKALLGEENVGVSSSGWMDSFTINDCRYTAADMGSNGSWSAYRNNAEDSVVISQYQPTDGDVYRVILTEYDGATYQFPVMTNDLDGLYWAMAEYAGAAEMLQTANALVQSAAPGQSDLDEMTRTLATRGGTHQVLTDRRTIQVDTTKNPYVYINTLSADRTCAAQGDTVTVTVTVPGGLELVKGSLTAGGVALTPTETANRYAFTMPDHPVTLTAEFAKNDSGSLRSAVFSYDAEQTKVIPLTPAFNKNVMEYALTVCDYEVKSSKKVYASLTFDEAGGTKAAWQYYMVYSGYGSYTDGPKVDSGVVFGHKTTNIMSPGMTNGYRHRVNVTPAGGVARSYYIQMTMLPTLSQLTVDGQSVQNFAGNCFRYDVVVPDEAKSVSLRAVPYAESGYSVYLNAATGKNIAGTDEPAALEQDGTTELRLAVDDGNGKTTTYTITVKTETVVAREASEQRKRMNTLMEHIASTYVENHSDWVIIDMAAYGDCRPTTTHKTSATAKQNYINGAAGTLATGKTPEGYTAGDTAYDRIILATQSMGVDPRSLYPVNSNAALDAVAALNKTTQSPSAWNAPYTLAAYHQGQYGSGVYEQALLDAILTGQGQDTGAWTEFGDSIQATANMLIGLAFEYPGNARVKAAVERGVTYLSSRQAADGTFDAYGHGADANTAAMVVVALASVGINPDTDMRFVKEGNSALDGLLSFALADDSGFGYNDCVTPNAYATEQSFRALIAAGQVMSTGKAYNLYDFSKNTVEPGRATGSGTVVKPDEPSTTNTISVYFTLKSDVDYWISKTAVTVKEGSTVYHAFKKALDGTGITYVGAESGYIRSITKGSKTLAEFTDGENSGWLYKVNGAVPDAGLTSYTLQNGDNIVWYYTDDWTRDSGAGGVQRPQKATVIANETGGYSVTLPKNNSGRVLVTIPNVGAGQVVVILHKDGRQEAVKKSLVQNGSAYFLLGEDATIKVVDYVSSFDDVTATAWYSSAVDFAVSRGLFSGVGENCFAPGLSLSRGMLVTVLYALEEPGPWMGLVQFSDVETDDWYAKGTQWAVERGIVSGCGGGLFAPEAPITREQLALMLYQYARSLGMSTDGRGSLADFRDGDDVSDWARTAVSWAVDAGILSGRSDGTLDPGGNATRGEAVVMLRRLVAVMLR